jgi:hypothetical protein
MRLRVPVSSVIAATSLAVAAWHVQAQTDMPNVSGNYLYEPEPMSCLSGQAFSIGQSGNALELKSDKGEHGNGRSHQRDDGVSFSERCRLGACRMGGDSRRCHLVLGRVLRRTSRSPAC